ncbi:hypothetical protein Tco_0502531 [Tanacetum coccineum]
MSSDSSSSEEPDSPKATPTSPDYVPGPEEPEQVPPSPDYVPGPKYPEYLAPADDEIIAEDQPYADSASPVALSPGYVADSDPEEDSKDGPVDYPADGGDDDDDDDSSDDDEDKEASEEEEHLAPADSVIAPAVDPIPSSEETEPFETDESAATPPPPSPLGARISIRPQAPMPFPSEEEVKRLLALPSPPPSPLISLSPPSAEERLAMCLAAPILPLSPLPIVPHPYGSPNHVRAPTGFRASMGRLRTSSPSTTTITTITTSTIITIFTTTCTHIITITITTTTTTTSITVHTTTSRPYRGHSRGQTDSLIIESRCIDRGQRVSPGECVVDGAGGFNVSRGLGTNNMPPKRTSAAAARVAAAAAVPMTADAVEKLIEARVSAAFANHETL